MEDSPLVAFTVSILSSTRDALANMVSFPVHSISVSEASKVYFFGVVAGALEGVTSVLAMISPSSFTSLTAHG